MCLEIIEFQVLATWCKTRWKSCNVTSSLASRIHPHHSDPPICLIHITISPVLEHIWLHNTTFL